MKAGFYLQFSKYVDHSSTWPKSKKVYSSVWFDIWHQPRTEHKDGSITEEAIVIGHAMFGLLYITDMKLVKEAWIQLKMFMRAELGLN